MTYTRRTAGITDIEIESRPRDAKIAVSSSIKEILRASRRGMRRTYVIERFARSYDPRPSTFVVTQLSRGIDFCPCTRLRTCIYVHACVHAPTSL